MEYQIKGVKELKRAIKRNPDVIKSLAKQFLTSGIEAYRGIIIRNPWKVGGSGGGAPVDLGGLRGTHEKDIGDWEAKIFPTVEYKKFVHDGTRNMKGRPWLNYAKDKGEGKIKSLEETFLKEIVKDLEK